MPTTTRRKTRENGSRHPRYAKPPVICPPTLWLGRATPPFGFAHVIDAAYSEADNQFYVAGIPALTGWTVTDSGLVETVRYDMGTTDHVAVLGPGRVAVSRRGDSTRGGMVEVLAVDDFAELSNISVDDAAGMAKAGDLLYILAGSGALHTYDIADLEDP